ncbi:MAG: hypothetical protein R3B84_00575 [Zavarzinella sp.]
MFGEHQNQKSVARFLPILLGATVSYPLILIIRASGNLFIMRWVTLLGLPLTGIALLVQANNGSTLGILIDLALVMSVVQATRSLRSDIAEEGGPAGDLFLVWADLGYGLGTFVGILLWAEDLGNFGMFRSALMFAACAFFIAWIIDMLVARSRSAEGYASSSETEHHDGDVGQWDLSGAKWPIIRWAAVVPLLAIAVQITVMRQTDRFNDFFAYMSFDIGTVIAGISLGLFFTVRVADTPFNPPGYIPKRRREGPDAPWKPIRVYRLGIVSWLGLASVAMFIGYGFESVGFKVGECIAYGAAGIMFEALWLVLLGWLAASARHFKFSRYISVSSTIGAAIFLGTISYALLTYYSDVHPIYVTIAASTMAFVLVLIPSRPRKSSPTNSQQV